MDGNWFDEYTHELDENMSGDFNPFAENSNVPTQADEVQEVTPSNLTMAVPGPSKRLAKRKATAKKLPNFTVDEDKVLISCWLNVSTDPIVSTGQRLEAYWKRIFDAYNGNRGSYPERTQKSLTKRWDSIKENVSLFAGFYQQVLNRNQSGTTDSDKVVHTQFYSLQFIRTLMTAITFLL